MSEEEFDLTPDPRVLQMLGEINLQQWRCLAELIDNSIDGFASPIAGGEVNQVNVTLPASNSAGARVVVRDNGPGMSIETLEQAVRAGWTGKDGLSKLGLFGMGFNIATARLGLITEVWTTRANDPEWVGVRIDLEELRTSGSFRRPRQTRAKSDPSHHGTEIVITKLKPDQRAYLARPNNQKTVRKHLARTYSALLDRLDGSHFVLKVNEVRIEPRRHCIWSPERSVELSDGTAVHAVERFNVELAPRRYCSSCMRTLEPKEASCPTGGSHCNVIETPRRIRGWIGLQRYLDDNDFGFDFVRNGRKIEIGNKDLFYWSDGDTAELEYPVDDPRNRGRFVGEIHLDHCRVSYTKDRFERDDPAWAEMVRIVRGDGPLRPREARRLGYDGNDTPLYKLFQAFRRSSPQGKAGRWTRVLVVKENERARQMADQFHDNEIDYITDERWWQIVEEQDRDILQPTGPANPDPTGGDAIPDGFIDGPDTIGDTPVGPDDEAPSNPSQPIFPEPEPEPEPPEREALYELSRKYAHPTFRVEYEVQAFAVSANDPDLPNGSPWVLLLDDVATRTYAFLVALDHQVFRSMTMTPLDALMTELSHRTVDFLRNQDASLANTLAEFRQAYCSESRLDPKEIIANAQATISDITASLVGRISDHEGQKLFDELADAERETIVRRMASREISDHKAYIRSGEFWDLADGAMIVRLLRRRPSLFFDGSYWSDPYEALDFGAKTVNEEARERLLNRYSAYLVDATWLASRSPNDLERSERDAIVRATYSLRLLRPDTVE